MHELHELKEKLIRELADYGKNELSTGSLEIIDKLAHAAKNVCKLMEDGQSNRSYGRSYDGSNRSYDGSYEGFYEGSYDGSYDGESNRRGRGRYARRDSMGRYADSGLAKELKELMEDAPEDSKQDFKRLIQKIEMM